MLFRLHLLPLVVLLFLEISSSDAAKFLGPRHQRWRVVEGIEAVAREGPSLDSAHITKLRPGAIVFQAGPAYRIPGGEDEGIVRLPVKATEAPDAPVWWVTQTSVAIGGPVLLRPVEDDDDDDAEEETPRPKPAAGAKATATAMTGTLVHSLVRGGETQHKNLRKKVGAKSQRACFNDVSVGGSATVRSVKVRGGGQSAAAADSDTNSTSSNGTSFLATDPSSSFLMATVEGAEDAQPLPAPTTVFYETLLGEPCGKRGGPRRWLVDVGSGGGETSQLAAHAGCNVAAFDMRVADMQSLSISRCLNAWESSFLLFPTMATSAIGGPVTLLSENQTLKGVSLDGLFQAPYSEKDSAVGEDNSVETAELDGEIALLKITPGAKYGPEESMAALEGARGLIEHGRVGCLLVDLTFSRNGTWPLLRFLGHLNEKHDFSLSHAGPRDSPSRLLTSSGAYPLYRTNYTQLESITGTLERIRKFDERTGTRAYGSGISLDRDGNYFELWEQILACSPAYEDRLKALDVRPQTEPIFKDGMWWLKEMEIPKKEKKRKKGLFPLRKK